MVPRPHIGSSRAADIAAHYRRMVGFFGLQFLVQFAGAFVAGALTRTAPELMKAASVATQVGIVAAALAMVYQAFRLAAALGTTGAKVCAGALLLPYVALGAGSLVAPSDPPSTAELVLLAAPGVAGLIALIALLRLSASASAACKAAGLPVGLLGPRRPKPPRG